MNVSGRPYRQVARATRTAATADRILDAAVEVFWEGPTPEISLEGVAARAGVSGQTVIRQFGGRAGLFAAAAAREAGRVARDRDPAAVAGDPRAAVHQLVDHYEAMGDRVVRMLAEETRIPSLGDVASAGRQFHRHWCETVFASTLAGRAGDARERRLAQFVAICDVYVWKLLRRDAGLSRDDTELALLELLSPIVEGS